MGPSRGRFSAVLLAFQIFIIILFAIFCRYDHDADAAYLKNSLDPEVGGPDPDFNSIRKYYPMFQDVHVMIFIGFGFLMTFLKQYGYSAVGVNMLLAAVAIQWAALCQGFFHFIHSRHYKILINITTLLNADFASATVLISFGVLLGKTSPLQLLVMSIIEIVLFAGNEWVSVDIFGVSDVGASMLVHTFGAYFGLAVSLVLHRSDTENTKKAGPVYHSDVFAMIGTIFLWLFWPSFNGALAPGHAQHRVVVNTYYSLAACCVTTFAISAFLDEHGRFNMVHVQNSTLAGGVAIGTSADLMVEPYGAMLVGVAAAVISVLGYQYLAPLMTKRLRIHDTCGVNNLHGMPGVLAGLVGALMAAIASEAQYGLWYGTRMLASRLRVKSDSSYFYMLYFYMWVLVCILVNVCVYNLSMPYLEGKKPCNKYSKTIRQCDSVHKLYMQYPKRAPKENSAELKNVQALLSDIEPGEDWSALKQAGFQLLTLFTTLVVAIFGGLITGLILRIPIFESPTTIQLFDDEDYWETPEHEEEVIPERSYILLKQKFARV